MCWSNRRSPPNLDASISLDGLVFSAGLEARIRVTFDSQQHPCLAGGYNEGIQWPFSPRRNGIVALRKAL